MQEEKLLEGELEENEKQNEKEIVWDSLALKEFPVRIERQSYVLVETTAEDARKWRANNLQSLTSQERGKGKNRESTVSFLETLASSQILLVSLCLYKIQDDGSRTRVSRETIKSWPNELVERLFEKAQEISALRDFDENEEGEGDDSLGNSQQKKIRGVR